ncbi:MAG: acyl-CoA thioesterase [Phycisphaerales bacterium]|nr:MAG: acyl-CoA thioesterase [Phycisphaerales bacterium]
MAEFTTSLRVRYCECDPMGVAHHGSFPAWLEEARTEMLRGQGRTYAQMEADGLFLVVTKLELQYRRPARYDDVLDIRVKLASTTRVKLVHDYAVILKERSLTENSPSVKGDVLVTGSTTLACVGRDGKLTALPEWLQG